MSKMELHAEFCVFGEGEGAIAAALSAAQHGADTVLILQDEGTVNINERNLRVLHGTADALCAKESRLLSVTTAETTVLASAFARFRHGEILAAIALPDKEVLSEQSLPAGEFTRVIRCTLREDEALYGVLFDSVCDSELVNLYRGDGADNAIGQVIGTAAAIGVKYGALPSAVGAEHMTELHETLLYDGAFLPHIRRTVSEDACDAELSCDDTVSGDILNLRTGIDQNSPIYGDGDQGFTMAVGATVEYHMDEEAEVSRARIVFDDTTDRSLAKVYALEIESNGEWEGILFENENRRRLITAAICRPITGIRLTVMETWGAENVHLFSFDFE